MIILHLFLAVLATAGVCFPDGPYGPDDDRVWTAGTSSGANTAHWEITQDVHLTEIQMYLYRYNGTTLTFVVYESLDNINYTLIHSDSSNQGGTNWEWHVSPPMDIPLVAGRYYAIGLHWDDDVAHSGSNAPSPTDVGFGIMLDGAYGGSATGQPPELNRTFSYGYWNPTQITVTDDIDEDGDGDGALACNDCDDLDPNNFPGNPEDCDGLDNDCDGVAENGLVFEDYYPDSDGDGHGDIGGYPTPTCDGAPSSLVLGNMDCDDSDAYINPGEVETTCDGIDNDCNPGTLDTWDDDVDGVDVCIDCDDLDPANFPGNPEICDGLDNDCVGGADDGLLFGDHWPDSDSDGYGDGNQASVFGCASPSNYAANGGDCNDADPNIHPGVGEVTCDGIDNDCNPLTIDDPDGDGDGVSACSDCDDGDSAVHPGAPEICDGADNDCDLALPAGEIDDDGDLYVECAWDVPAWLGDPSVLGGDDCDDTDNAVSPGALDLCGNGIDDNCDGLGSHGPNAGLIGGFLNDDGDLEDYATELLNGTDDCNPAPVAATSELQVDEGETVTIDATTLEAIDSGDVPADLAFTLTGIPTAGSLALGGIPMIGGGTFTQDDIDTLQLSYTHDDSEVAVDSFAFDLRDPLGEGSSGTLDIHIAVVNDAPTLTTNPVQVDEGDVATLDPTYLLADDDEDGSADLTYVIGTAPSAGVLNVGGNDLGAGDTFTQLDVEVGAVAYLHDGSETTVDLVELHVEDSEGSASGTMPLEIDITPINDTPEGTPDYFEMDALGLTVSAAEGVLANDIDGEGGALTATLLNTATSGTLTLNADGGFSYFPSSGYTGPDAFDYVADDGLLQSEAIRVNLLVLGDEDSGGGDSDDGTVELPRKLGCGCQSSPGPGAGWLLLPLILLGRRRSS